MKGFSLRKVLVLLPCDLCRNFKAKTKGRMAENSKCKQRLKFVCDRRFDQESDRFVEMDDDDMPLEPLDEEFGEKELNENQNAKVDQSPLEEGEASDSGSDTDLRKVIQEKRTKTSNKSKGNKAASNESLKLGEPSTSRQSSEQTAHDENQQFENFMVWMDRYKKFQEWEASNQGSQGHGAKEVGKQGNHLDKAIQSPSESTVYTRMCKSLDSGLNEPNSDQILSGEFADTSGVMINGKLNVDGVECSSTASTIDDYEGINPQQIDSLILEARQAATMDSRKRKDKSYDDDLPHKRVKQDSAGVSLCGIKDASSSEEEEEGKCLAAEKESKEQRDRILLDAELHRAQLLKPGMFPPSLNHLVFDAQHKSLGSHVDRATELRIVRGEFIDLQDLLVKRRNNRGGRALTRPVMRLINDGTHSRWVEESDDSIINSYRKWEEAFEIYASIYICGNPEKAQDLYDYKFTIRDAANTYIWDNVYEYDIEFRLHIERCKNQRRWSAKLDYEWTRCMKNHIQFRHDKHNSTNETGNTPGHSSKAREICNRYNKGRCTWGSQCRYLHICKICKKRGHGASICRNAEKRQDRGDKGDKGDRSDKSSKSSSSQSI